MSVGRLRGVARWTLAALLASLVVIGPQVRQAHAAPISEDPDSSFASPLVLPALGFQSPVNATINAAGDEDGFQFAAQAGKTYVVELFNVSTSLNQGQSGYVACAGVNGYFNGMALLAYDTGTNSLITGECDPNGNGNVLVSIMLKAGSTSAIKLKVYAQVNTAIGTYSLRVLPRYGEEGASWDATTFEPNNRQENAFLVNVGLEQAITSRIDERDSIYATNSGDDDWYRFEAVAGRTYTVELFNVSGSLNQGQSGYVECAGVNSYYSGLALLAFDTSTNSRVAGQCSPNGDGNVFVSITFKAGSSGTFTLLVYGQVPTASGNYGLRVLPRYGEEGASWEATTFEPNNREVNAYAVRVGREQAITTKIEERNSIYATNSGDEDWYRFEAVAGRTYTVELFNVSGSLNQGQSGYVECAGVNSYYSGLALLAFDTSTNSRVAGQCNPNGGGNVLVSITFKAGSSGTFTLRVYGQVPTASGNYSLRVLPKYGEEGASWEAATFEPNNQEANAYAIGVGSDKALVTSIEQRNSVFATDGGDEDWYRFEAVAGETYIVDLYNVSSVLEQGQSGYSDCGGTNSYYKGLALIVKDTSTDSVVASRCNPTNATGSGTSVSFKAAVSGVHTLRVYPQKNDTFGSYSIRVRPASELYKAFVPLIRK